MDKWICPKCEATTKDDGLTTLADGTVECLTCGFNTLDYEELKGVTNE